MTEKPIRPHDMEVIERLTRLEQKLDSYLQDRPCGKYAARLDAIERKVWVAIGGLAVISSVVGYLLKNLPLAQLISGGTP